ncbi:DUF2252 domain-containing protein [Arthrobacter psychrochitiniphilus]|uniref:DUF2252 domain-containing protein n=1 Tax=Arthrobacter psychrochitiniphilus TaxID=291045 RepID=UPI003F7B40C7
MTFDINDFDETLPGPWEWDLKRLAASFEIGTRNAGFTAQQRRKTTLAVAEGYRKQMRGAAKARVLDAWYDRLDADRILSWVRSEKEAKRAGKRQVKKTQAIVAKARTKDSAAVFSKLVREIDGELRIQADPPLIEPIEDLIGDAGARNRLEDSMRMLLHEYAATLAFKNHPVKEFSFVHMARKVVGVGSVGTRAWILLLTGRDANDPLVLQAKEAQESVLERYLGPSQYPSHGQRVVEGQRLLQASGDIFLGWQSAEGVDGIIRDFYLRQLHDWKGSVNVDDIRPRGAKFYASVCGQTLARAHARAGDRMAIAAYLGISNRFDEAIATFSSAYAEQNERDYEAFVSAVTSGRIQAVTGL